MKTTEPKQRSPFGWEMVFSWCPPEDSPLLGGTPERRDDTDTSPSDTAETPTVRTRRRWRIRRRPRS